MAIPAAPMNRRTSVYPVSISETALSELVLQIRSRSFKSFLGAEMAEVEALTKR
jgi:hypothetical protein